MDDRMVSARPRWRGRLIAGGLALAAVWGGGRVALAAGPEGPGTTPGAGAASAPAGATTPTFPTFARVLASARDRALAVVDARSEVGIARSTEIGARVSSFANPYVEVQMDHGRYTQDVQIAGVAFLPFEINGQRGARIEEAERLARWKRLGLDGARGAVLGEVTAAYADVVVTAARVLDATRAEADARTERSYFEQRIAVGDATIVERSQAEAEVARWSQIRAEARIHLVEASSTLSQLAGFDVGEPDDGVVASLDVAPTLRAPFGDADVPALVENSPILKALAAESGYWAASATKASAEKNVPLNLLVLGGRGDGGEMRAGGGLSWTLPVTQRNQGPVARAEAERARALASRDALRGVLAVRAKAASRAYALARAALADQDATGIPAAERAVQATFDAYRAGKGELFRVLIARRDLVVARGHRLDFVAAAWRAYGELAALKGDLP